MVGERVRQARDRRAMTQDELAKASGVSVPALNRIENTKGQPRATTIRKLAGALRVRVEWLTVGEEPVEPVGIPMTAEDLSEIIMDECREHDGDCIAGVEGGTVHLRPVGDEWNLTLTPVGDLLVTRLEGEIDDMSCVWIGAADARLGGRISRALARSGRADAARRVLLEYAIEHGVDTGPTGGNEKEGHRR